MSTPIEITGGAGPEVAAAVAALVASIEAEEDSARASQPRPIVRSAWVEAGRPNEHVAPLTPTEYARRPGYGADGVGP